MSTATLPDVALHRLPVVKAPLRDRLRRPDLLIGLFSALIALVPTAIGIGRFPAVGGDEGIYTGQAAAIMHGQITAYTYTYDHPFFGWLQIAPFAWISQQLGLAGDLTVVNTRVVMVGYAFASLLLIYGIMRRFGTHRVFAAATVLGLGFSPLFIDVSRQVFLDNIALVWVLAALYLCLSPARKQWTYGIAGVLLAVGILSKETVLLLVPAFIYLVWTHCYKPLRLMCMAAFVALGTMTVLVYPLFAILRRELFPGAGHVSLWDNGVMYQLANRKGSGSLWETGSARYDLWQGWLAYDHWLVYVGSVCALACLGSKRYRTVGFMFVLWALPVLKPGGYLPAMYIIVGLPFMAMGMGGCADVLTRWILSRRWAPVWTLVAATVVVWGLIIGSLAALVPSHRLSVSTDEVAVQTSAVHAMEAVAKPGDNILTDDSFWLDLVNAGHGSVADPWHGAISYYQFDLDPVSSSKALPQGWQDLNYVLLTDAMVQNIKYLDLPKLEQSITHSTVVQTFGSGSSKIEIRKILPTDYNTGATK